MLQRGKELKRGKQTKAGRKELTARERPRHEGHKRNRKHQEREGVREQQRQKGPATGGSRGAKGPGRVQEGQRLQGWRPHPALS